VINIARNKVGVLDPVEEGLVEVINPDHAFREKEAA
jgi:hypothetical protein